MSTLSVIGQGVTISRLTDYMRYALTNYTQADAQIYFGFTNGGGGIVTNVYITNFYTTNFYTTNLYLNTTNGMFYGYTTGETVIATNFIGNGRNLTNYVTTNLIGQINSTNQIYGLWNLTNTFGQLNTTNALYGNFNITNLFGLYNISNTFGLWNITNTFGLWNISNVFGLWNLTNTFGNINLTNTFGNINLTNTFGNINLTNTFGKVNVTNTYCTGTVTPTVNASALISASAVTGNDCDFIFTLTTNGATQQANSNYVTFTFSTVAPNGIICGLSQSGTNSAAAASYDRFTLYADSPTTAKLYTKTSAPGASSIWTFAIHVGRY